MKRTKKVLNFLSFKFNVIVSNGLKDAINVRKTLKNIQVHIYKHLCTNRALYQNYFFI